MIKQERRKAQRIMRKAPASKEMQVMVYWFIILSMIILTLIVSVFLVPFFIILPGPAVFLILFLLGLSFGAMFQNLIFHLEELETSHHILAGVVVPLIAAVSLMIMVRASDFASSFLNIGIKQDPLAVALFYLIGFLIPYVYGLLYMKRA